MAIYKERYKSESNTHTCDVIKSLYNRRRTSQNQTDRGISERIWYLMVYYGIFGHILKRHKKT